MSYIKEKVAYTKGLMDGLNIQDEAQKKLFAAILEALDIMADAVEENEASIEELSEDLDVVIDEVDMLDSAVFEDDFDDDDDFVDIVCPNCNETVCFETDMLDQKDIICPLCNEPIVTDDDLDDLD